jgi:hypothetical protein
MTEPIAEAQSGIPLIAIARAALRQAEQHCTNQDPGKHPWLKLSDLQAEYVEHALVAVRREAFLEYAQKLEALGEIKPSTLTVADTVKGIIRDLRTLAGAPPAEEK